MRAMAGKLVVAIEILLAVLVALAVSAALAVMLVVHTEGGRAWLGRRAASEAQVALGAPVEIADLDLGFPLRLVLRGIVVGDPGGGPIPFLRLDRAEVSVNPIALWRRRVVADRIHIGGFSVAIARDADGALVWPGQRRARADQVVGGGEKPGRPWRIAVRDLALGPGRIVIAGRGEASPVVIDSVGVEGAGELSLGKPFAGALRVDDLTLVWTGPELAIENGNMTLDLGPPPNATLVCRRIRWAGAAIELDGALDGSALTLHVRAMAIPAGHLGRLHAALATWPALSLDARVAGNSDSLFGRNGTLDVSLAFAGGGAEVRAAGVVRLAASGRGAEINVSVARLDPSRFDPRAPRGRLNGRGRLRLRSRSAPEVPIEAALTFDLGPSELAGVSIDRARIAALTHGRAVTINTLELNAGATHLVGEGRLDAGGRLDARAELTSTDLEPWRELLRREVAGDIALRVAARGVGRELALSGDFESETLRLGAGLRVLGAGGAFDLAPGSGTLAGRATLNADSVVVHDALRAARVEAAIDITPASRSALVVDADAIEISGLAGGPRPLHVAGSASSGGGGRFTATVTALELGADVVLTAPLGLVINGKEFAFDDLSLLVAGASVEGRGSHGPLRSDVSLSVEDLDLAATRALLAPLLAGVIPLSAAEGQVDLRLAGEIIPDQVTAKLDLDARELLVPGVMPPSAPPLAVRVHGDVERDRTTGRVSVRGAGGDSLGLDFVLPLSVARAAPWVRPSSTPLRVRLAAHGDSLAPYLPLGLALPAPLLESAIVARANLGGSPARPEGRFDLEVELPRRPGAAPTRGTFALLLGDERIEVDARLAIDGSGPVRANLLLPAVIDLRARRATIPRDGMLRGEVGISTFDLGAVRGVLPRAIVLGGLVDLTATIGGTVAEPALDGTFELSRGRFELRPAGLVLESLFLNAEFDERRFTVLEGNGRTAAGTVTVSGGLPLPFAVGEPVGLRIKATGLAIHTADGLSADGDLDLAAGGTIVHPALSGRLLVNAAEIPLPERRKRKLISVEDEGVDGTGRNGREEQRTVRELPFELDLDIHIPRRVWLANRQVSIEIGGQLHLKSEAGGLSLAGALESKRGSVRFLDRVFTVTQGDVTFYGGTELNPTLDIQAETEVRDARIILHLRGTARAPEFEIASVPDMDEADIISLLLFGKGSEELTADERNMVGDRAEQIATMVTAQALAQAVGAQLGLDLVQIESSGNRERLTVGKYLSSEALVRVYQEFGSGAAGGVVIEYWLLPQVQVEVSADAEGKTAIDLLWRRR